MVNSYVILLFSQKVHYSCRAMDIPSTALSTPTKRSASSPLDQRPSKRPSTSSPEEGELDDGESSALPPPSHLSPDLPPRPSSPSSAGKFESKIKFPFKAKLPSSSAEPRSSSRFGPDDRNPAQQYERAPEDDHRRDKLKFRDHRQQDGPSSRRRMADRWVPDERSWDRDRDRDRDRRPPHPQWDSSRDRDWDRHPYDSRSYRPLPPPLMPPRGARDRYPDRNFDRGVPRDLARTPPLPQSHRPRSPFSPRKSQSRSPSASSPNNHRKHRLPTRRSPVPAFSPLSRDFRADRVRPELWDRDQRPRNSDAHWGSSAPGGGASKAGRRNGVAHELPHLGELQI